MIRLVLAGCGEHSRTSHATPLARYASEHPGEIELVAACDLNADKAAEFCRSFGFLKPYTDFDQMLAQEKPDEYFAFYDVGKDQYQFKKIIRKTS